MECVDFCAKKIAVVFNEGVKNPYPVLQNLEQILLEKSANPEILEIKEMKYGFDFVFAVGGDGTILHVSKFYAMTKTPVLGINLGRLGYLSQVNSDNIKYSRRYSTLPTTNGSIKSLQLGEYADMVPKTVGGSATTYMCDYYWQNSNLNTLLVGGRVGRGSDEGLASFYGDHSVSNTYADVGARGVFVKD